MSKESGTEDAEASIIENVKQGCDKRLKVKGYSPNNWMSRCGKGIFLCGKCAERLKEKRLYELSFPKDVKIGKRWFGAVKDYHLNIHFIPFEIRELKSIINEIEIEAKKEMLEWFENEMFPIYKGLISKPDAWEHQGDQLCELIEDEMKKKIAKIKEALK